LGELPGLVENLQIKFHRYALEGLLMGRLAASPAQTEGLAESEADLAARLSRAAGLVEQLIDQGLAARGATDAETAPLLQAYEAALLVNFSPSEVQLLHRLLARVEAAARRLAARPPG
jgi:hypothetical protein